MVPFGALLDFRPPEPLLKKLPKMQSRGVPGLFLGYALLTGGRWSGDYLVSPLSDWGASELGSRKKIRVFRVKEIFFDATPEKITFPMREVMDKVTRSILVPPKGMTTDPTEDCVDDGRAGESLSIKEMELPVDKFVGEIVEEETPEEGAPAESPDFELGTEPPVHTTEGTLPASSSGGRFPERGGEDQESTEGRVEFSGPVVEDTATDGNAPSRVPYRRWERRTDPYRPDYIAPSTWAPMLQSIKDGEYQKWLLADPEAAERAQREARDNSCRISHNRRLKELKYKGIGLWERWDLTSKYQLLPHKDVVNEFGEKPPAWDDCVRRVTLRADKVLHPTQAIIEDLDLVGVDPDLLELTLPTGDQNSFIVTRFYFKIEKVKGKQGLVSATGTATAVTTPAIVPEIIEICPTGCARKFIHNADELRDQYEVNKKHWYVELNEESELPSSRGEPHTQLLSIRLVKKNNSESSR